MSIKFSFFCAFMHLKRQYNENLALDSYYTISLLNTFAPIMVKKILNHNNENGILN